LSSQAAPRPDIPDPMTAIFPMPLLRGRRAIGSSGGGPDAYKKTMRVFFLVSALFLLAACSPIPLMNRMISRAGYHVVHDLPYGSDPRQKLDFYVPDHPTGPVLLFFYGGGWQGGSKSLYPAFGQAFASRGILTAVADYRLYPQVRYPAFIEDSAQAFAFVRDHAAQYGGDPKKLFLSGHSAGAYNAMMLAADPHYLKDAGAGVSQICGVIGIAGPYDFLPLIDPSYIAVFEGRNRPETQPIHHIDGKRPPMLLAYGVSDTTVEPGNSIRLAAKLESFGSPVTLKAYPHTGHIGIILSLVPGLRWTTTLHTDMLEFIGAQAPSCTG
jgi:acetyl esterase/lipase